MIKDIKFKKFEKLKITEDLRIVGRLDKKIEKKKKEYYSTQRLKKRMKNPNNEDIKDRQPKSI